MTGSHPVQTWSPAQLGVISDEYLERLAVLYRADGTLHGRFDAGLQQQDAVGEEEWQADLPVAAGSRH